MIKLNNTAHIRAYIPEAEVGYQYYKKRPAIILAPGGAYLIHATREKEGVALEFLAKGYNVFILEYSIGFSTREVKESGLDKLDTTTRYPIPVLEMMETIHYIKEHSEEYNTDTSHLFLMGFSAGAHVCASCGIFWNDVKFTKLLSFEPKREELKVSGMVLCYPLINPCPEKELVLNDPKNKDTKLITEFLFQTQTPTQAQKDAVNLVNHVNPTTISTFIWHSIDDPIVYTIDTTRFILALQQNNINCEYHLFDRGGHGLALANKTYARNHDEIQPDIAIWTSLAHKWMEKQK